MTLKELKILEKAYQEEINLFSIESLEKQIAVNQEEQDKFTIEFADWININAYKYPTKTTTKELLETFKKEKGL